jgi:hypothetical protein
MQVLFLMIFLIWGGMMLWSDFEVRIRSLRLEGGSNSSCPTSVTSYKDQRSLVIWATPQTKHASNSL